MNIYKLDIKTYYSIRFVAHLMGTLMMFLLAGLCVKEILTKSFQPDFANILFFISIITMFTGFIIAWKNELFGGSLIIFGFILFIVESFFINNRFAFGYIFTLIPFTGLIYLYCCRLYREK